MRLLTLAVAALLAGCVASTLPAGCRADGTGCTLVTVRLDAITADVPGEGQAWTFSMAGAPAGLPAGVVEKAKGLRQGDSFSVEGRVHATPRLLFEAPVGELDETLAVENASLPTGAEVGSRYWLRSEGYEAYYEVRSEPSNGRVVVRPLLVESPRVAATLRVETEGETHRVFMDPQSGHTTTTGARALGANETAVFYLGSPRLEGETTVPVTMTFTILRVEPAREGVPTQGPYAFPAAAPTTTQATPPSLRLG